MVSVSVNSVPVAAWDEQFHRIAERVAARVLEGCGVPSSDLVSHGGRIYIVRRQCTDVERKGLIEKYLQVH